MLIRNVALLALLLGFLNAQACSPEQEKCSIALTDLTGLRNDRNQFSVDPPSSHCFACKQEDYACSPNQESGEVVVQQMCTQPASKQCKNNLSANKDHIHFNFLVETIEITNLRSILKCWCISEKRSFIGIARTAVLKNCGPTELASFSKYMKNWSDILGCAGFTDDDYRNA
uniref:DUF19 domain-containing protein n=1 Tax=Caenorhabditis japonica TaxID=281687 RepID=A0A8R1HIL7_CAEJA